MNFRKLLPISVLVFIGFTAFSQATEFPTIMYVNATSGLRMREDPYTNSKIIETLPHGERIVVTYRAEKTVTIDRITDYWYKISNRGKVGWVFGGFISENLPADLPAFVGLWEEEDNNRHLYYFNSNFIFNEGAKESEWFRLGKWELNGNTLSLITESGAYEKLDKPEIQTVQFFVINKDTILLTYSDGREVKLIRSNDLDVHY